jgi:hypothetical protein
MARRYLLMWIQGRRLETRKLPRVAPGAGSVELRASELAMLPDGIDRAKLKRVPRYERPPKNRSKDRALVTTSMA